MGLISAYSSVMIVRMANENNVRTLESLSEHAFGPIGFFGVCVCQILFSVTLMCIALEVWGDIISGVFQEIYSSSDNSFLHELLTTRYLTIILGGVLVLPLCLFTRSMATLSWSSYCTILAVTAGIIAVISSFYLGEYNEANAEYADMAVIKSDWWTIAFIITISFSYNQKAFTVYSCLRRRDTKKWRYSVTWSHAIITGIYILLGSFGYMSDSDLMSQDDVNHICGCRNRFNYFAKSHLHTDRTMFHIAR